MLPERDADTRAVGGWEVTTDGGGGGSAADISLSVWRRFRWEGATISQLAFNFTAARLLIQICVLNALADRRAHGFDPLPIRWLECVSVCACV